MASRAWHSTGCSHGQLVTPACSQTAFHINTSVRHAGRDDALCKHVAVLEPQNAKLARLSGLSYRPAADLRSLLEKEGLRLVAQGQTNFTRWYVADENLLRCWPEPFAADMTQPRGALQAHAGVSSMAHELYQELLPHLAAAASSRQQLIFGGHSMGGALAVLLAALAKLQLQISADRIHCVTFGAPPVLALGAKANGRDIMQVLGLPPTAIQSFVLDNDPIPRAMLSVDPTFALLKRWPIMRSLLELRQTWLGPATAFTPSRFLFDNAGEVYLIRWTLEEGHQGPTLKRTVTTSKYDASTAAVDDLAKYLTEAREQADAAEAKRAAQADQEFTPNWRRTGLPAKPSPLLVEADRLRAQGILDPKQPLASYHVVLSKEVLAPPQPLEDLGGRDAPPHYMATTTNLQNRSRTLIAAAGNRAPVHNKLASWHLLAEEELQQKLAASAARRKAMMQTMSNDQWDQEQKVIKNIKQKLSFLRNPRYVPPSSPTKREQRVQWGVHDTCKSKPPALKVSLTSVPGNYFLMEPAIIQFGDYQIGQTYEVAVKLRNVDHVGRRARLLPPATPFFSLSPVTFPAAVGVIAPGMHCEFRVYFTPHSLADYDDGFTIESDRTQLHIPVTARRPPPLLSLPGCIDLGHVVLGNVQVVDLPVHNAGGAGRFEVASLDGQPLAVQEDGAVAFGRFRLSPSCFALGCNETTQLQVTFSPDLEGDHHEEFKLVCDNGQQLIFTLYGRGAVPRAAMAQIDGHGISEQDLQRPLWFGEVVYGTEPGFERSLVVHNATPLPFPFVWRQTAGSGADAGAFSISPSQGSLPAGNDATFAVRFRPAARGRSAAQVQLLVDTSVDGHLQQYDHLISQIDLEGVGVSCAVEVQPSVLCCAGPMGLGQERRLPVTIHNHSNVVADLAWQNCDQCIAIERAELAIAPGAVLEAHVVVRALEVGGLHRRLEAHVSSGQPLTLDVSATVHGPKVEMQAAAVDFGLVRINTCATTELLLLNTSAECEAAWQLSEVVQADAAFAWPGLSFSQSQGVLPPSATIKLQVTFQAGHEGQLCSILRCEAEGGQAHHLSVAATVVAPRLALDRCLLDLANTYVGMLREERLLLRNMTMLPTRFAWQQPSGDAMQLDIHPAQGELGPGEQVEVAVMLTPLQQGSMEVAADCLVADMAEPLGFGVRTHAGGLAATYEISPLSQDGPPPAPSSTPHHAHQARPLLAHFGECCPLGSTQRLLLTVRNGSAIAAPVAVWLDTFGCPYSPPPSFGQSPAAGSTLQRGGNSVHAMHSGSRGSVHAPDSQAGLHSPHPSRSSHPSRASHRSATKRLPATIRLDNRHEHSAAFHGRTGQLAVSLRDSLAATRELSGSRGIAIAIASTTHMLPAWGVAQFELICYTDMVGDYTDVLHVQVGDLPIQDIPMRIGSFHAYAAPPPVPLTPLRIDLVGEGIMPVLEPEYPDDGSQLSFRCSASDDPLAHSSYSKHVILTNRQACPLTFSLIPEGPFMIASAAASVQHPISKPGRGLGMPKTQIVMVTYTPGPGGSKPSTKSLMFSVRQGQGCTVQLAGTGSLEEGRENIVKSLVV
ncbi:hypothetical protein WJX72_009195 [[Myrmecia] bisecta]|uniref:Uncharacterized protein n=1 Tax=[Myrmecia] bisecta TaxID=41462 RepID=A0AAW1QS56_9CHLO